jgi:hypothetical protein
MESQLSLERNPDCIRLEKRSEVEELYRGFLAHVSDKFRSARVGNGRRGDNNGIHWQRGLRSGRALLNMLFVVPKDSASANHYRNCKRPNFLKFHAVILRQLG